MMLVLSLVLALLPLLGVAYIILYGAITTVDGLFTALILLGISGILGLNVLLELKARRNPAAVGAGPHKGASAVAATAAGLVQRGRVENVQFYESGVGEPNKSIVTLSNGSTPGNLLVFDGDVRNALPVGQKVAITFRKEPGRNVLVDVSYS
ncbi:MAG TPA: hypothetical protein VFA68_18045 [Terriglobales bacterium]|nr:hypothetical protein [Terriglobales bacterium]